MKRKIVKIHEEKCNGCGICVKACHEGAIQIIDGKAKVISDEYCDGLGDCLPGCPEGAIEIIEREAVEYSEEAVQKLKEEKNKNAKKKDGVQAMPCGCPGTAAKAIVRKPNNSISKIKLNTNVESEENNSELRQWPVQLKLINTRAPYLKEANLLVAADCTAYAYANFHKDFIKDHITVIGCPKLDDVKYYEEKLAEILTLNDIKSITVVRMEVPCCGGIVNAVKTAMLNSQTIVPYREVIVGTEGNIISQ
ncbi:4Fe-4S binding protein [Clostridium sp.]|jgi:NAD-dependent dihydropyrimidine dehydrogenase PreA subunit|uniref:ATP-binding protein n=1 Tax=Clostridium sp. TaxID=1506 RepID=UPI002588230C|nr:4Fe-4S binding protein [Clostridium sp.]MDF2505686.1 iron-sulfur cluster-binding protein [Clostridium sp.]